MGVARTRAPAPQPSEAAPLAAVLRRLAEDASRSHASCAAAEIAVADALGREPRSGCDLAGLQHLDALTQHLAAYATICEALSVLVPSDLTVDLRRVCRDVSLEALNLALAGLSRKALPVDGDVDLF